MQVTERLQST